MTVHTDHTIQSDVICSLYGQNRKKNAYISDKKSKIKTYLLSAFSVSNQGQNQGQNPGHFPPIFRQRGQKQGRGSLLSPVYAYSLLAEVALQQALEGLAVAGLVAGHLVGNWL